MDRTENHRVIAILFIIVVWVSLVSATLTSCNKPEKQVCIIPPSYDVGEQVIIDNRLIATVQEFLKVECSKGWYRVEVHIDLGRAGAVPQQSISMIVDTTRMKPYPPKKQHKLPK
jgi:hypothetical protein